VGLAAVAYVPRWRRVRAKHGARGAPVGRLLAFATGLLALIAALISPIDRLAEQSFAMHMVQHILLLDVVPILLIASLTKVILRPATRRLQRLERALRSSSTSASCGAGTSRPSTTPRCATRSCTPWSTRSS
jgi:putative membrane protein